MLNHISKILISLFLILSVIFTSCNGQTKNEINKAPLATNESYKISKPKQLYKEATIDFGFQDKDGNRWFGSNGEGVFKYDGKVFTNYTTTDGLNSNNAYSIVEDQEGIIWVGTNKGLNRFNGKSFENTPIVFKNSFITPNYSNNSSPTENSVWSMMVDKKGTLWLGTDDGVYCYSEKVFARFLNNYSIENKDSLQLKGIFSILETSDESIWFTACQSEGISKFDGKILSNVIPYKDVRRTDRVIQDKNGNLWFACVFKGVGLYDGKTFTQNVFNEKSNNGPSNILEDAKGNIWFNSQNGLNYYDGKTVKLIDKGDSIPDEKLIPLFEDKSGQLWLSSKRMGLYIYKDGKFISFSE
jgi:ligand-binding sensor domain-containing protein